MINVGINIILWKDPHAFFRDSRLIPSSEAISIIEQCRRSPPVIDYSLFLCKEGKEFPLKDEYNSIVQLQPYSTWEDRSEPIQLPTHGVFSISQTIDPSYSNSLEAKINKNESTIVYQVTDSANVLKTIHPKASTVNYEKFEPFLTSFGKPNCFFRFYRSCFGRALRFSMFIFPFLSIYDTLFYFSFSSITISSKKFISDENDYSVESGKLDLKVKVFATELDAQDVPQIKEISDIDYSQFGFDPGKYSPTDLGFEELKDKNDMKFIKNEDQPSNSSAAERIDNYKQKLTSMEDNISNLSLMIQQQQELLIQMKGNKNNQYQKSPIQQEIRTDEGDTLNCPLLSSL